MTTQALESGFRRFLLLMAALIMLAALVELVLEEHTKETLQLIPFFLCGLGLLSVGAVLARPQRRTLLALRAVMVLLALGGLLGVGLHLANNVAFEKEIRPNAAVGDLFVQGLKGANPLLAPGVLVFAALLATAATYYHPALGTRTSSE
jgi:hypothetical protein